MVHDEDDDQLLRMATVLDRVRYKDWRISVHAEDLSGLRYFLQIRFAAPDPLQRSLAAWAGRKWRISPHMTDSEIVLTALKAVLTAEEHEAREKFTYRGKQIFGPHIDVQRLWDVCNELDVRDPT